MTGVLEGIRVLDFGRYIAAPFCGALLGDLGAEVIRVDRDGGNDDRWLNPVTEQAPRARCSSRSIATRKGSRSTSRRPRAARPLTISC